MRARLAGLVPLSFRPLLFSGLVDCHDGLLLWHRQVHRFREDSTQAGEHGNYFVGFPQLLGKATDPAARVSELHAELANGRRAIAAIIDMSLQDNSLALPGATGPSAPPRPCVP